MAGGGLFARFGFGSLCCHGYEYTFGTRRLSAHLLELLDLLFGEDGAKFARAVEGGGFMGGDAVGQEGAEVGEDGLFGGGFAAGVGGFPGGQQWAEGFGVLTGEV